MKTLPADVLVENLKIIGTVDGAKQYGSHFCHMRVHNQEQH